MFRNKKYDHANTYGSAFIMMHVLVHPADVDLYRGCS